MKRGLLSFLLLISIVSVGLCAKAEATDKDTGYISVSESITKEIPPNQAEISIGIETSDKSLQKASEDNNIIANKVYSSLKTLLGPDDYIKTSNYSARPQYSYTKENKRILDKYIVSNAVLVRTKKLDLLSKLIDTAIAHGATNIESLNFSSSDSDKYCNEALADLTKKAYDKADTVAKSIHSQILGIKALNVACNAENNTRMPCAAMMDGSTAYSKSSTPLESGKIKIYANINASFYVK